MTNENEGSRENNGRWNTIMRPIAARMQSFGGFIHRNRNIARSLLIAFVGICYILYMIAAMVMDFIRAIPLLVIFLMIAFLKIYSAIYKRLGRSFANTHVWSKVCELFRERQRMIKWFLTLVFLGAFLTWIVVDHIKQPRHLVSLVGYIVFIIILFAASKFSLRVLWKPIIWGLGIQICLGILILRTQAGFSVFNWMGFITQTCLKFVTAGSKFVFGELYIEHYFAFMVLPTITFVCSLISILYHLEVMEWLLRKLAWLMQFSLGTSATESICAAGNIFLGSAQCPLLIRPYVKDLTKSELNAVMTGGFATASVAAFGAYFEFGISPLHIISASVMAAPCSLAISKLVYPETEKSKFNTSSIKLISTKHTNIIEAACVGAASSIPIVLSVAVNLIAFISLLAAVNAGLSWCGGMLDCPELSFELICSYIFIPVTYLLGIEWQDCFKCGELLGAKIFLNDFIAYEELGKLIRIRKSKIIPRFSQGSSNWISDRSEIIITYALYGFGNLDSLGITLGSLCTICPERQNEIAGIIIRSLFSGIFVGLMNASLAGLLYIPSTEE